MGAINRIVIEPTASRTTRGQVYRVYFGGELIKTSWCPEFDACRVLVARGLTGSLEVWRAGKAHADMTIRDIRVGARLTVEEGTRGPLIVPWRPWVALTEPDGLLSLEG
jgi:hypothetical protein